MKQETVTGLLGGLVAGLVLGGLFGYQAGKAGRITKDDAVTAAPAMPPPGMGGGMPGGMPPMGGGAGGPGLDVTQRILANEAIVARDPKNLRSWVTLGNDYFDTHQYQKAVESYGRALELDPNNADVLTDQGVMYRNLGQFDRAIANFEKASKVAPQHVQSLFNLGVVYQNDLKDNAKAAAAWNRVIQIAPNSPQARDAQAAIAALGPIAPAAKK